MKVLVDTSCWIDFFNGHDSPEAEAIAALIDARADVATCGVIVAEFFQGLREQRAVTRLEPYFRELTMLVPREPATYFSAAHLYRSLRRRGVTIRSTIDCLIARLAEEN